MSRGEGQYFSRRQAQQVLGLAGKEDNSLAVISVIEGADADGITGGDVLLSLTVIEDAGEFRIQHPEHLHPVFPVQREQQLTVRVAGKGIFFFQSLF